MEQELKKILEGRCSINNIKKIMETINKEELKPNIMLESIEILKMHEEETRRVRQTIELAYQTIVLEKYLDKKNRVNS